MMKTIKQLAKEYYKPDSMIVDWSKVVGKNCVIETAKAYSAVSRNIQEVAIIDFEENTNLIKFKYMGREESSWVDPYDDKWKLIFVFEPVKPEEPKNYKDLSLILEEAKKNNEYIPPKNPLRPIYPWNPPVQPYPGYDYPVNPPSWPKPLQPYCLENDMFRIHEDEPTYSTKKEYDDHEPWTCHDLQN